MAAFALAFFLMHCTQLVHGFAAFPTDDPTFIYRAAEVVINLCFFGLSLPLMLLSCVTLHRHDRRYGTLNSEDPGEQARQRRRHIADKIRQGRVVYADPRYRYAEEFVARETLRGWRLYLTVYRATKADRDRQQSVIDLACLTTPHRYFNSPNEAINCWVNGFSLAGDHAKGTVYQLDGCEYSLRYALKNAVYLGVRMEHLDGSVTYQHGLDRFSIPVAGEAERNEVYQP